MLGTGQCLPHKTFKTILVQILVSIYFNALFTVFCTNKVGGFTEDYASIYDGVREKNDAN